jgi:mRNA interferase MazF
MPGSETALGPWDIVKVPFPYTSGAIQQFRPALIISIGLPVDAPFFIWVLMITSAANRPWTGDVGISELEIAGLPVPSVVRTDKVATVEISKAERIGRLVAVDKVAVKSRLQRVLQSVL